MKPFVPLLNERGRRLNAAAEARAAGYGGVAAAARVTKVARSTIGRGPKDLRNPASLTVEVRCGRAWTSGAGGCSARRRRVRPDSLEGGRHVDRNAQFEFINAQVEAFQAAGQPVISVDTKKKEPIGPYKNAGGDYCSKGCPDKVSVHDFVDEELGKVAPYGVYDIGANVGWVSVGIDHDTSEFAVNSIRRWRDLMGRERYPASNSLMITCDGGGSNGSRVRLWKVELQKFADETGLTIAVRHYP
jgi:hypothetical protein